MKLFSASTSLLTTLLILSDAVWKASGEFTEFGNGYCKDSANHLYPVVIGSNFSQDKPQSCYDWCTQANADTIVGFSLHNEYDSCVCNIDYALVAKVNPDEYTNPLVNSSYLDNRYGSGKINAIIADTAWKCYQNDNFVPVTPSPSAAPVTLKPTTPFTATPVTATPVTNAPFAAPVTPSPTNPGWNITYDSMKANLTASGTEELIFVYNISSSREHEHKLYEKDCSTQIEIGGNLITDSYSVPEETNPDGTDRLVIFYDINMTAVPSSSIWNQTSEEMEVCLLLSLFEPATADDPRMIIAQDKHVFTVGINSTANLDFSFDNALQDAVVGEASSTANLDDYVEACKCTEEETFECDSSPLAPSEVFHVCVKSSSSDVQIRDVTQMNIDQGDQSLTVVEGSQIKYSSFSSKIPYPVQNGYKINVLLPINLFNFSGPNVTVEGSLEMQLGEGRRALRKLVSGNVPEAAPFKLEIALTDTPLASDINDAEEEDSVPPGFLVPVLAVVGSISLLAMAGMAVAFRKRGSGGNGGIVA
eukprot:scaffold109881_cov55-Cyclotella_meneghiniana.AAC.1